MWAKDKGLICWDSSVTLPISLKDESDFTEPHWKVTVETLESYPVDWRVYFSPLKFENRYS